MKSILPPPRIIEKFLKKYKKNTKSIASIADFAPIKNIEKAIAKRKIKPFVIYAAIVLMILLPVIYILNNRPKESEAAWFDDTWKYRQRVPITNSGSAQTNYEVGITIDTAALITAGKMQSDCDDIRVTTENGELLSIWIQEDISNCNSSTTKVWVKVPSIGTDPMNLYLYYGNSAAATVSDGNKVFMFFDDFDTNTLLDNKWDIQQSGSDATLTFSSGVATFTTTLSTSYTWISSKSSFTSPYWVESYVTSHSAGAGAGAVLRMGQSSSKTLRTSGNFNYYDNYSVDDASDTYRIVADDAPAGYLITSASSANTSGVWRFSWISNSSQAFFVNDVSTLTGSDSTVTQPASSYVYIGNPRNSTVGSDSISWIFARKYAATAPAVGTLASEEKSEGPMLAYKFDEGTGTTIYDSSGSGYNGTASNGPVWNSNDTCLNENCLHFDGSDDQVDTGQDLSWSISQPFSFSVWVKPTTSTGNRVIFGKGLTGTTWEYSLRLTNLTPGFTYWNTSGGGELSLSSPSLTLNSWSHLVITYDGVDTGKIYLNGKLVGTDTVGAAFQNRSNNLILGRAYYNSGAGGAFQGYIDNFKVYNYARTDAQVYTDYNITASIQGLSAAIGEGLVSSITSGLVGYWKFDESTGDASDSSGNGATLTNKQTVSYATGKFGNAADVEKASMQYFTADSTNPLSLTGDLTLSAWINPESTTASTQFNIVGKWQGANTNYMFAQYADELRFYMNSAANYVESTNANLTTGNFYHVAVVYSTNQTVKLYLNGVELSTTTTGTIPSSINSSSASFYVGAEMSASPYLYIFRNGKYEFLSDILGGLTSKEVESETVHGLPLNHDNDPAGTVKLKISEELSEIAYLNHIYLRIDGKTIVPISNISTNYQSINLDSIIQSDNKYHILNYGDEIFIEFKLPEKYEKLELIAKGFYQPIESYNFMQQKVSSSDDISLERFGFIDGLASESEAKLTVINDGESVQLESKYYTSKIEEGAIKFMSTADSLQMKPVSLGWEGVEIAKADTSISPSVDEVNKTVVVSHKNMFGQGIDLEYLYTEDKVTKDVLISDISSLGTIPDDAEYLSMTFELITNEKIYIDGKEWNGQKTSFSSGFKIGSNIVIPPAKSSSITGDEQGIMLAIWGFDGHTYISKQIPTSWLTTQNYPIKADLTITLDSATTFESGQMTTTNDIAKLDSTKFVIAFTDDSDSGKGKVIVGTLSGTTITISLDSATTFESGSTINVGITAIDTSRFVIVFKDGGDSNRAKVIAGSVSGTSVTITLDGATTFDTSNNGYLSITTVGTDRFVIAYLDAGDFRSKVIAGTVSGTTITITSDSATTFDTSSMTGVSIAALDSSRYVIAYGDSGDSNKGKVIVGSVATRTITITQNGSTTFESGSSDSFSVAALSSSAYLIAFKDLGDTNKLKVIAGTSSGNSVTISLDTAVTVDTGNQDMFFYADLAALDATRFVIAYVDRADSNKGKVITGSVSGTTISITTDGETSFETGGMGMPRLVEMSSTVFTISFYDSGDSSKGKVIAGEEPIPPTNPYDGLIDEVRVYNRALSPTEISALYELSSGPVAYYNFDDGSGTSLIDKSTNSNTGTLGVGSSAPQWAPGKYGSSLKFDGSNDVVSLGTGSTLDLTTEFTISMWVNRTSATGDGVGYERLYARSDKDSAQSVDYGPYMQIHSASNTVYVGCGTGTATQVHLAGAKALGLNRWHHVTGVKDASGFFIYIDGVLDTSGVSSGSIANCQDNNWTTYLGKLGSGGTDYFGYNGYIDDVRVYNYKRTPKQIIQDLNAGHPLVGTPVSSAYLHFRIDEGLGTTLNNAGVGETAANGTLGVGSSAPLWSSSGKFNRALNFDGSNDNVTVSDSNGLDFNNADFSITGWFYRDTYTTDDVILAKRNGDDAADQGYLLYVDDSTDKLVFEVSDATDEYSLTSTTAFTSSAWNHFAVVWDDDSAGATEIYINGRADTATDSGTLANIGDLSNSVQLRLGDVSDSLSALTTHFYDGLLDEIKVYDFALSGSEVQVEYNYGKTITLGSTGATSAGVADNSLQRQYCPAGDSATCDAPQVEYRFDENTGTSTITDSSGSSLTMSTNGSMTESDWVPGINGSALDFDGVNDYLSAADNSAYDVTNNFTITAWIKPTDTAGIKMIVSKFDAIANIRSYQFYLEADEKVSFGFSTNGTFQSGNGITSVGSVTPGQWNHVALTFASGFQQVFINGRLDNTNTSSGTSVNNSNRNFMIGAVSQTTPASFFPGGIDNARLYNYVRSARQIAWEYSKGAPVAHYKIDECEGTTLYNSAYTTGSSAPGINGTLTIGGSGTNTAVGTCLTSGAWADGATGKINSSIDLDGNDDYATISASSAINVSEGSPFTVSAWVKRAATGANHYIVNKQENVTDQFVFALTVNSSDLASFNISRQNNTSNTVTGVSTISSGQWYMITGVYDGSNLYVYVNGRLEGTLAESFSSSTQSIASMYIGQFYNNTNRFEGQIDDVRLYRYNLTQQQINAMYNNGAVNFE